jgi:lysophospholipase L1-like esterase
MFRLAFQILEYRPSLIVTYGGANDAGHLAYYQGDSRANDEFRYPVGTPESFDLLAARVDDIEGRARAVTILETLLPEVTRWINARSGAAADPIQGSLAPDVLREGAARYLANQKVMHQLSASIGARFVSVFQPHLSLHTHVAPEVVNAAGDSIARFYRAVLDQYAHDFEFHDLGGLFDESYAQVPVVTGRRGRMTDVTTDTVFIGRVHLSDAGNGIVARRLAQIIR